MLDRCFYIFLVIFSMMSTSLIAKSLSSMPTGFRNMVKRAGVLIHLERNGKKGKLHKCNGTLIGTDEVYTNHHCVIIDLDKSSDLGSPIDHDYKDLSEFIFIVGGSRIEGQIGDLISNQKAFLADNPYAAKIAGKKLYNSFENLTTKTDFIHLKLDREIGYSDDFRDNVELNDSSLNQSSSMYLVSYVSDICSKSQFCFRREILSLSLDQVHHNTFDYYIKNSHRLETTNGSSGSMILSSQGVLFGMHTADLSRKKRAFFFNSDNYQNILSYTKKPFFDYEPRSFEQYADASIDEDNDRVDSEYYYDGRYSYDNDYYYQNDSYNYSQGDDDSWDTDYAF